MDLLKKLGIKFDKTNNTTISKEKLLTVLEQAKFGLSISEFNPLPGECYLLIDHASADLYPIPTDKLTEWENDGSCEAGDSLYKMTLIKKY